MQNVDAIKKVLAERPSFHRSETEISRSFDVAESLLPRQVAEKIEEELKSNTRSCYGLDSEVLSFIAQSTSETSFTLETGAGCSTLIFAIKQAKHFAITPSHREIELIKEYAQTNQINLNRVQFISQSSDHYLPQCVVDNIDLVLLDGKHAFPWPIIDWFYTADRLRKGGILIVDDVQMRSVSMLTDFLKMDPGWKLLRDFSGKTNAFLKVKEHVHDVAWHMQPFTVSMDSRDGGDLLGIFGRIGRKLDRFFKLERG